MTMAEVGKSYFPILHAYQKQVAYMQHYGILLRVCARLTITYHIFRGKKVRLSRLNCPMTTWFKFSSRQRLKNGRRSFLVQLSNSTSLIFKALLIILRNLKSEKYSKRNVVRSKQPTIPSLRKRQNGNVQNTVYKVQEVYNPENKGKTKPGKENVSQTDIAIMMTQEQLNAILERRFPRNAKSGTRKNCD